jgi:hypothetical protein
MPPTDVPQFLSARFMLTPLVPLDKEFLRELRRIAIEDKEALPAWAENFRFKPEEEAVYFDDKEWRDLDPKPASYRVDLYTLQRGLVKVFDPKHELSIAMRQMVLRSLFEQQARPNILQMHPLAVSRIIQLALFDQVVR